MKNIKKINLLLALFAVSLIIGLSSCMKEDPISTPTTDQEYDYVSYGTLIETIEVSDLSMTTEMMLLNEMEPVKIKNGGMFGGKTPMYRFKAIFDKLKLTEEQKTKFDGFFIEHIDCEKSARKAFFDKISSIMEEANTQRQAILDQLKSGAIDKVKAKEMLKELNDATKSKIESTGAQAELKEALQKCLDNLIEQIRSELSDDQLSAFNEWLAKGGSNIGTGNGGGKGNGKDPGNGGKDDDSGKKHLNPILVKLKFTDAQIILADPFFKAQMDCYKVAHEAYNTKVAPFFEEAKIARDAIMELVKAGTIDKETAHQQLQIVDANLKTKIDGSGAQVELEAALKLCDENLKISLKSIMTPEQIKLFEDLLAKKVINLHGPGIGPKK